MTFQTPRSIRRLTFHATAIALAAATLAGCDGADDSTASLTCDDSLKTAFKPDDDTSVVAVKSFKKGDTLSGSATAANDTCMVKLLVGPGNPGPADAPSTSPGIGIEVWLPTKTAWNGRIHALGGGGWQGGAAGTADTIASTAAAAIAGTEGAVSSTTDTGHPAPGVGSFAMNPDGTINRTLWTDFAARGIHQQAVKTKALVKAFYGRAHNYAYWEGGSTGGRQGLNLAQNHPEDFDGIVALYPAINWTRFITSELYPQVVYQRDLAGTPLSKAQSDFVSNKAITSCDSIGLGFILDPSACTYNPLADASALCTGHTGDGVTGSSTDAACVTAAQAQAINKIWYGMTSDGSVPAGGAGDNGWAQAATSTLMGNSGTQRWFGLTRGTTFYSPYFVGLGSPDMEFPIASDMVALEMQNPTIAGPGFKNASGNGQSLWKQLSYAQLSNAYDRGVALQSQFGNIDSNNTDLTAFKSRGGKLLTWHGLADELIVPQGTINYYHRVAQQMGGVDSMHSFYRLYLVPGAGHGTPNGTANASAVVPNFAPGQMYEMLTNWVEKGAAPGQVTLTGGSGATARSIPACLYPKKVQYLGGGTNVNAAASYQCS